MSVGPVVRSALQVILPTPPHTIFLRACLWDGAAGAQAWRAWKAQVGDVRSAMAEDTSPVKRLLPLLYVALRRNGAEGDEALMPYLKLAFAREQMRSKTFIRICREVAQTLAAAAVPTVFLRGAALSVAAYSDPSRRHCHDIDLLVARDDVDRAVTALRGSGLAILTDPYAPAGELALRHDTGLPVRLHTRLFASRWYELPWEELWTRAEDVAFAATTARGLCPADALLHVLGHASYAVSRGSLRWVCDSAELVQRRRDLDWEAFVERSERSRLSLLVSLMLRYLADQLDVPVPSSVLERMDRAARKSAAIDRDVALFGARAGSQMGAVAFLQHMPGDWRVRGRAAGWLLFPSRAYVEHVVGVRGALRKSLYYVARPLGYLLRAQAPAASSGATSG